MLKRTLTCVLWIVVATVGPATYRYAYAQSLERTATETKAVYMKYIAQYTTWPDTGASSAPDAGGNKPMMIGVVGPDPNGVIEVIRARVMSDKGMTIQRRSVVLMDFPSLTANAERRSVMEALDKFDLLFFSADSQSDWVKLKPMLQNRPIMTVSELPGFAVQGGIIEYDYDQKARRMYMIVNMQALQDAGVVLSASLLDLKIIKPLNLRNAR